MPGDPPGVLRHPAEQGEEMTPRRAGNGAGLIPHFRAIRTGNAGSPGSSESIADGQGLPAQPGGRRTGARMPRNPVRLRSARLEAVRRRVVGCRTTRLEPESPRRTGGNRCPVSGNGPRLIEIPNGRRSAQVEASRIDEPSLHACPCSTAGMDSTMRIIAVAVTDCWHTHRSRVHDKRPDCRHCGSVSCSGFAKFESGKTLRVGGRPLVAVRRVTSTVSSDRHAPVETTWSRA